MCHFMFQNNGKKQREVHIRGKTEVTESQLKHPKFQNTDKKGRDSLWILMSCQLQKVAEG